MSILTFEEIHDRPRHPEKRLWIEVQTHYCGYKADMEGAAGENEIRNRARQIATHGCFVTEALKNDAYGTKGEKPFAHFIPPANIHHIYLHVIEEDDTRF